MSDYSCALVTGASSGIGAAFAEALARSGSDLVLVARSEDKLRALRTRLAHETGRRIEVVVHDLSLPGSGATLRAAVDAFGLAVDLLVNNAGFGTTGAFVNVDAAREAEMIALNCAAVVDLSHAFLPAMLAAKRGAIVNIASSAAFQPMPYMSVYAATKAFVYSFGDGLWAECRGRGVHVMSVCPGPVDTAFFEATGAHGLRKQVPPGLMATAEEVVAASLRGLNARERVVVPGAMMKLSAAASGLLPRRLLSLALAKVMQR